MKPSLLAATLASLIPSMASSQPAPRAPADPAECQNAIAENIGKVDKFIADLEPTKPTKPTKLDLVRIDPDTHPPASVDPDPGGTKRMVGYILLGIGGGALIGGTAYGLAASGKSTDVTHGSGPWDPTLEKDGERAQRNSRIFFGIAGVTLIGGGVLYYLGHKQTAEARTRLTLAPNARGASLVWSGKF